MTKTTDYHGWTIPTPYDESSEDEDVWGDVLNTLFDGDIDDQVILKDTLANRPAAGTADRWFLATDQNPPSIYLDDGASWVTIWDGDAFTLDGLDSTQFLRSDAADTMAADLTFDAGSGSLTDGGSVNSPAATLTGYYDSDGTTSVTASALNAVIEHVANTDGSSVLDFRVQGSDILRLNSNGETEPTGDLRMADGTVRGWEGNLSMALNGYVDVTGWDDADGGPFRVSDGPNGLTVLRTLYGGNVEIPHGYVLADNASGFHMPNRGGSSDTQDAVIDTTLTSGITEIQATDGAGNTTTLT